MAFHLLNGRNWKRASKISCLLISLLTAKLCFSGAMPAAAPALTDLERIHSAATQLARSQLASGFYPYDFNFADGHATPMVNIDGLNLVRQSGAAFALAEYFVHFPNEAAKKSLAQFLAQSAQRSLPIGKGAIQSALEWSGFYNRWQIWMPLRPFLYRLGLLFNSQGDARLVAVEGDYERAWPGATALALSAAIKYFSTSGDNQFNDIISRWKAGLLALQVPRRGLREAPHYLSESDYVNGETWLALAEYNIAFPDDKEAQRFLRELEDYLFVVYGDGAKSKFFHWGMMAAVVRANQVDDARLDDVIQHLAQGFLNGKEAQAIPTENSCATIEGLATYVAYMNNRNRGQEPLPGRARTYVGHAMATNRQLQVGPRLASFLPAGQTYAEPLAHYQGAFIESLLHPRMQVDYTQHCLNALLRMRQAGLSQ